MSTNTSLVITSISAPNSQLKEYTAKCTELGINFILIGDVSSPSVFNLPGCNFYSIGDQDKMNFKLAEKIPQKHYARKNLGYLEAMRGGATIIRETDDDNAPLADFWNEPEPNPIASAIYDKGWINVYKHFSDQNIWPRGFPLDEVQKDFPELSDEVLLPLHCPIQQGLANLDPDVDAVYRLVLHLPIQFMDSPSIALGRNAWCPFNSQNTSWFKEAFPLLYLPSYCSFRMTDIWRSFVAQRICWENNWHVLFHKATVYSERNDHDLVKDFSDEIMGYLNNKLIVRELNNLPVRKGKNCLGENLLLCYEKLVEMNLVNKKELELINCWLEDIYTLDTLEISHNYFNQKTQSLII